VINNKKSAVELPSICFIYCDIVIPRLHDTTGCQTGLTTGCIV